VILDGLYSDVGLQAWRALGNIGEEVHFFPMKTAAQKRNAGSPKTQRASLRKDVRDAIYRAWPDGLVELSFDPDESYFCDVLPKLSQAFQHIPHAQLLQERKAEGGPIWWDNSDREEDPPDEHKPTRSYHLFFISPEDVAFRFETEAEGIAEPEFITGEFDEAGWGEDPVMCPIAGSGRTGWVVAVSLAATFAVIELGDVISYEDGSATEAALESYVETEGGKPIDAEEHFRKTHDANAYQTLVKLRAKISDILEKRGITVLPAEEWRKLVPGLRGGQDTIPGIEGNEIRVLDAFFFEEL
jgi:hypothetical protein